MNQQALSSLIWSVTDLLRGDFKQSEYGRVILPFTVLRSLDCVPAPTKEAVLLEFRDRSAQNVPFEPSRSSSRVSALKDSPRHERGAPVSRGTLLLAAQLKIEKLDLGRLNKRTDPREDLEDVGAPVDLTRSITGVDQDVTLDLRNDPLGPARQVGVDPIRPDGIVRFPYDPSERSFLQSTPQGDLVIVTVDGADPAGAASQFDSAGNPRV
jgi:hypothetical protein